MPEDTNNSSKPAAREIETIRMKDGRELDFAGKRKMLRDYSIDRTGTVTATFDFRNGATVRFEMPETMKNQFAGHGAIQKIGDETAGLEDVEDQVLAVENIIERLGKGEWNVKRESTGLSGTSVLLRALVKVTNKSVQTVKDYLATLTPSEKLALRASERVAPVVREIEAARSKGEIDTEALLAKLV